MKTIILSETQEKKIVTQFLREEMINMGNKEELVQDWLTQHFKPIEVQSTNELSLPQITKAVSVLDTYGQMTKQFKSLEDVFYIAQTRFKNILSDKTERDNFLKDTINKWYN